MLPAAKAPRTPCVAELGCRKSVKAIRFASTPATTGLASMRQSCAAGTQIGWLPMPSSIGWSR